MIKTRVPECFQESSYFQIQIKPCQKTRVGLEVETFCVAQAFGQGRGGPGAKIGAVESGFHFMPSERRVGQTGTSSIALDRSN